MQQPVRTGHSVEKYFNSSVSMCSTATKVPLRLSHSGGIKKLEKPKPRLLFMPILSGCLKTVETLCQYAENCGRGNCIAGLISKLP